MAKIFAIIICLLAPGIILAQERFSVGVSAGPQYTTLSNDLGYERKLTVGYASSLSAAYDITKHVGIETGIGISQQGQNYKVKYWYSDEYEDQSVKLKYLFIPVCVSIHIIDKPRQRCSVIAGGRYNSLLEFEENFAMYEGSYMSEYHKTDMSVILGLRDEIKISESFWIMATLMSSTGIKTIYKYHCQGNPLDAPKVYSKNFTLGLDLGASYRF